MNRPPLPSSFPTLEEKLAPARTALLIVDVQNDFCDPRGFYCHVPEYSQTQLAPINRMRAPLLALLEAARAVDCLRVFIRGIYDPVYVAPPFGEKLASRDALGHACLEGSWGADYWDPFRPQGGGREVEVVKHRNSAFHGTDLALILRANDIRTTVIAGVATSGCVDSTVRHAMFNDFFVILAADATADYVEERYRVHVDTIAGSFGHVVSSEQIVGMWPRASERAPDAGGVP